LNTLLLRVAVVVVNGLAVVVVPVDLEPLQGFP
jgi:hypothetical protein